MLWKELIISWLVNSSTWLDAWKEDTILQTRMWWIFKESLYPKLNKEEKYLHISYKREIGSKIK